MSLLRAWVRRITASVTVSSGTFRADVPEGEQIRAMPFELEPLEQDLTVIPAAATRALADRVRPH